MIEADSTTQDDRLICLGERIRCQRCSGEVCIASLDISWRHLKRHREQLELKLRRGRVETRIVRSNSREPDALGRNVHIVMRCAEGHLSAIDIYETDFMAFGTMIFEHALSDM